MVKRCFSILVCIIMLVIMIALTACTNEAEVLQARIAVLEAESTEMQSTISSLRTELERSQSDLIRTQGELQFLQATIEANEAEEQAANTLHSGPLAITSYGRPSTDMSWPLRSGVFEDLGVSVNWNEFDENSEIIWHSEDEDIFTVVANEDGLTAKLTPVAVGSAQLVVTIGDQETKSWIRIT